MSPPAYRLTKAAEDNLARLYEWGIDHFGAETADTCYDRVIRRLESIAEEPMPWQGVDQIRPGYRRSVLKAHAISYQIAAEYVLIVRILGRENPATSLPDAD